MMDIKRIEHDSKADGFEYSPERVMGRVVIEYTNIEPLDLVPILEIAIEHLKKQREKYYEDY